MKSAYQIIQKPVITEKGLGIKETQNTLVFQVSPKATKTEIKEAVQAIFKVKVSSVRTANYPGKERRRGKFTGYRPDWKKAYVRLKAGEKMPEYAQKQKDSIGLIVDKRSRIANDERPKKNEQRQ